LPAGKITEHLGQLALAQRQLMQGLQEYLGVVDVTGVDVAVPGLANDAGMAVGMRLMALHQ